MRRSSLAVIATVALPLLLACFAPAGSGEAPLSYAADVENLVVKRCVSCHTAEDPKAHLVLERGVGYAQLVDRPSVQVPEMKLVVPGDPGSSYMWLKLTDRAEVGSGMPRSLFGVRKLPDRELELIRRWIEDGARP